MEKIVRTDAEWKKLLTPEQYRIMRRKGETESPFCGAFYDHKTGHLLLRRLQFTIIFIGYEI